MPSDSDRIYRVSGSYETFIEEDGSTVSYQLFSGSKLPVVQTASLQVRRSVRELRGRQTRVVNRFLLGTAYRSEVSEDGVQSSFAPPPTRTHLTLGVNHAFVAQALSASRHEEQNLNCWNSGTVADETTAVPFSSSEYYSKRTGYRTVTYKYKTSASDSLFSASYGAEVSGSVHTVYSPRSFVLNVNETGRLVDIKVWVEVTHLSQSFAAGNNVPYQPLADLGIAIRSPNLRWGHAHPIQNDPMFKAIAPTGSVNFWDSTFLLWEGWQIHAPYGVLPGGTADMSRAGSGGPGVGDVDFNYPTWGKDRNMRTIFYDGASVANPRHLVDNGLQVRRTNGAPNSSSLLANPAPTVHGNDVPWMSDPTVVGAGSAYSAGGSPPKGWLNGAGGVALADEWPTTGVNYGAESIRPLYPLLDPIYGIKIDRGGVLFPSLDPVQGWEQWRGFRPGLFGTEISGTWEVLFAKQNVYALSTIGDPPGFFTTKTYVRQVRIELTYEQYREPEFGVNSLSRISSSPRRPGPKYFFMISGSQGRDASSTSYNGYDHGKTEIWTAVPEYNGIGRTFGIVTNTGSLVEGDFSLFYRLSGTLGDRIGESPWWLTRNEFGMPMIPDATSSLISVTPQVLTAPAPVKSPLDTINPVRTVGYDSLQTQFVRTVNPPKKLSELAKDFALGTSNMTHAASGVGDGPFVYVCDGSEGSEFFINLPTPRINDQYVVIGSFDGAATTTTIDFPRLEPGDRTKERFKVVLGAPVTEGDRIVVRLEDMVREI